MSANIPLIVYAILALIVFGLGDTGPAVVVAFMVLPSITLNVAAGVEGVDRGLLTMSRAYRPFDNQGTAAHRVPLVLPHPVCCRPELVRLLMEAGGAYRDVRRHHGGRRTDQNSLPELRRSRHARVDDVLRHLRRGRRTFAAHAPGTVCLPLPAQAGRRCVCGSDEGGRRGRCRSGPSMPSRSTNGLPKRAWRPTRPSRRPVAGERARNPLLRALLSDRGARWGIVDRAGPALASASRLEQRFPTPWRTDHLPGLGVPQDMAHHPWTWYSNQLVTNIWVAWGVQR